MSPAGTDCVRAAAAAAAAAAGVAVIEYFVQEVARGCGHDPVSPPDGIEYLLLPGGYVARVP